MERRNPERRGGTREGGGRPSTATGHTPARGSTRQGPTPLLDEALGRPREAQATAAGQIPQLLQEVVECEALLPREGSRCQASPVGRNGRGGVARVERRVVPAAWDRLRQHLDAAWLAIAGGLAVLVGRLLVDFGPDPAAVVDLKCHALLGVWEAHVVEVHQVGDNLGVQLLDFVQGVVADLAREVDAVAQVGLGGFEVAGRQVQGWLRGHGWISGVSGQGGKCNTGGEGAQGPQAATGRGRFHVNVASNQPSKARQWRLRTRRNRATRI